MTTRPRRTPRRLDEVPVNEQAAYIAENTSVKIANPFKQKLRLIRAVLRSEESYRSPAAALVAIELILVDVDEED